MVDWQTITVAVVVLVAGVYLAHRALTAYLAPSCGDCSSCQNKAPGKENDDLVQIRLTSRPK